MQMEIDHPLPPVSTQPKFQVQFFFSTSLEVDTTTILRFEIWQQVFNSFFASVNFRMRCTVQVQAHLKPEPAIGVWFSWVAAPNPEPLVWCGFGAGSGGLRTKPWPV